MTAAQLPLISLKDNVATVKLTIAFEDGPITLVGHSHGGVVVSQSRRLRARCGPSRHERRAGADGSRGPARRTRFLEAHRTRREELLCPGSDPCRKAHSTCGASANSCGRFWRKRICGVVEIQSECEPRPTTTRRSAWYLVATASRQPSLERAMGKAINAKTIEIASRYVAMLARPEETANLAVFDYLSVV